MAFLAGTAGQSDYWQSESDLASYDLTFAQRIGWKWDWVLADLSPGDEMVVHAGTYSIQDEGENRFREVVLDGTAAAPIVVRAAAGFIDPAGYLD